MPTYWGDLHGHSQLSDGRRSPDEYYTFARDQAELDFCALTDHLDHVAGSRAGLMPEESWERIKETTARFDEAGRFVTPRQRVKRSVAQITPGAAARCRARSTRSATGSGRGPWTSRRR